MLLFPKPKSLIIVITVYREGIGLGRLLILKIEVNIICAGSSVQWIGKSIGKEPA